MPLHPNSSSAESDLVPEPADELGSFSWTKQWYPVARVEDLDESKPTPCTYHGWKFDTDSACTSVPQAESPQQDYQAAAHLKATVYLSQVQHRLLWVWPEADPNAHLEAMSTEATVRSDPLHENHTAYAILWGDRYQVPRSSLGQPHILQDNHGFDTARLAAAALAGAAALGAGQTGHFTWLYIAVGTLLPAAEYGS
ncbi:MAG: hypothetical protein FRX49_10318 [Trebouxia sp. A1-2]|nr:MAG: hypothetical protein FRX49_10318 [Trebouxia sp. A1-2]